MLWAASAGPVRADGGTPPPPPGWRLAWSDEFDRLDPEKWTLVDSDKPTNNSLHSYLPEQVSVRDGCLEILSEREPDRGLAYRSGRVISQHAQQYGRWEVRAQLPAGRGLRSTAALLPDAPWPSRGEIDLVEFAGGRPSVTASAFHWGSAAPLAHDVRRIEQQMWIAGRLASFDEGFHDFAVEWVADQLRFYVDDVYHTVFYSDECGDFFPRLTEPMRLQLDAAIDGNMLEASDDSTRWPRVLRVDRVRVYEAASGPGDRPWHNGGFEARDGSLAGWHAFGNQVNGDPNIRVERGAARSGRAALRLAGQSAPGDNFCGASQGVSVTPGQHVAVQLAVRVPSAASLAGTGNRVYAKVEFYKNWGDYFGGPAMVGVEETLVADAASPVDQWRDVKLSAIAPSGAVEARLSLVFAQVDGAPGSVYVDDVELKRE